MVLLQFGVFVNHLVLRSVVGRGYFQLTLLKDLLVSMKTRISGVPNKGMVRFVGFLGKNTSFFLK